MLDLSTELRNEIYSDNRNFQAHLDITLSDGTVLNVKNKDIWQNSLKIEDATSARETFTIGAAVTGKMTVTLNNIYDTYSEYDFSEASVIAYIALQLENTYEKIRVGTYIVDEAGYDGATITLSCVDNLSKFDKPYTMSILNYPASLSMILLDACQICGISMVSASFPNSGYMVKERPGDEAITFGDMIAMVSQIAGCWAKMDVYGRLKLDWYDISAFERNEILDGGRFDGAQPYKTGDMADGGNFADYSTGYAEDGGTFEDQKSYHHIFSTRSFSMSTDDVVITGVRVTEEFEETDTLKKKSFLAGTEGYVVEVSGNVLIQSGNAKKVAEYLYGRVGGMRFRPLTIETLTDPSIEAGDIAYVTDRKQNNYEVFISTRTFHLGGSETISCDAETPLRNKTSHYSEMTKAVVKERNERNKQLSAYDLAIQQLTNLMTQSFGIFKTEEKLEDGSTIYYLHNKPELSASSTIWKMTADAFAVSTDGGKTWNAGIDSSGNAVVNVLSAVGINAEWIFAGDLVVGGKQINKDGHIKVYDADGNCICSMSKEGIVFDSENIKLDEESNMTLWGDMIANTLSVKDEIRISTQYGPGKFFDSLQALYSSIASNPFTGGIGNATCLHIGDGFVFVSIPALSIKEGISENLKIQNGSILELKKEEISFEVLPPTGTYDVTCTGTMHKSGAFVLVEGEIVVHTILSAGKSLKTPVAILGINPPNHRNCRMISNDGSNIFEVILDTSGYITIRNLNDKEYVTEDDKYIPFRFDYTLM